MEEALQLLRSTLAKDTEVGGLSLAINCFLKSLYLGHSQQSTLYLLRYIFMDESKDHYNYTKYQSKAPMHSNEQIDILKIALRNIRNKLKAELLPQYQLFPSQLTDEVDRRVYSLSKEMLDHLKREGSSNSYSQKLDQLLLPSSRQKRSQRIDRPNEIPSNILERLTLLDQRLEEQRNEVQQERKQREQNKREQREAFEKRLQNEREQREALERRCSLAREQREALERRCSLAREQREALQKLLSFEREQRVALQRKLLYERGQREALQKNLSQRAYERGQREVLQRNLALYLNETKQLNSLKPQIEKQQCRQNSQPPHHLRGVSHQRYIPIRTIEQTRPQNIILGTQVQRPQSQANLNGRLVQNHHASKPIQLLPNQSSDNLTTFKFFYRNKQTETLNRKQQPTTQKTNFQFPSGLSKNK